MQANAARLAFGRRCYRLRSPSARQEGDFSLPEPVNGVIMAPKLTESGECRIRWISFQVTCSPQMLDTQIPQRNDQCFRP